MNLPRVLFSCLALAGCILTGCDRMHFSGDRNEDVDRFLSKAKKLYEQRDYQGSIDAYEEILRIQPSHANAHFQIALIYDRNLNDYLDAAYHYQRFLQAPGADASKMELARGFLENARLQFAASVPNAGGQNSPDLVKLKTENAALHRQVEDLKREIFRLRPRFADAPARSKPAETAAPPPSQPPRPLPSSAVRTETRPAPPVHARTYTVKKGEGMQAIAEKMYGNRQRWREILAANPSIKDPTQIRPGQILVIP